MLSSRADPHCLRLRHRSRVRGSTPLSSASAALERVRSARLAPAIRSFRKLRLTIAVAAGLATLLGAALVPALYLSPDDSLYLSIVESLLQGRGLVMPDGEPVSFRPPLYVLTLLPGYAAAGIPGGLLTNLVLAAVTAAILSWVGWRLGGVLAGALVAVLAFGEVDVLQLVHSLRIDTSVTCAVVVAALLTVRVVERPRPATAVALGAVLGAAVLLKLTAAAFLPVPLLAAYWARGAPQRLARIRCVLIAYLVSIAAVAPWWIWSFLNTGRIYLLGRGGASVVIAASALVAVAVLAIVVWSPHRARGQKLAPLIARLEGPAALVVTVIGAATWGLAVLAGQFATEGIQDPAVPLRAVFRSTLYRFEPFLWPLPLAVVGWFYALWRLPRRRPVELVMGLALLSFVPVAMYVGASFYDPRSALPFFVLSALWEAAIAARAMAWIWRRSLGGGDARTPHRYRSAPVALAVAAVASAGLVGMLTLGAIRLVNGSAAVAAADVPDQRPEFDWRTSLVPDVSRWMEANVPPGSTVMTSWLYGAEIHRQTDTRYSMPQIPTVDVVVARRGDLFQPVGTGLRFADARFDPASVGNDWLFVRKHPHGPYVGLTQTSLLSELRATNAGYLVLTGEHPVRSTTTISPYLESHPAFRLLYASALPNGRAQARVYAVDPTALAPLSNPPVVYDPMALDHLAVDVPRVRLGWTQTEFVEALGGDRIVVAQGIGSAAPAAGVPPIQPSVNARATLEGAIAGTASLLVVAAWFLLPGLPWALVWRGVRRLDPLDTLVLAFVLSVAIAIAAAGALVALGSLEPRGLLVAAGLPALVGWVLVVALQFRSLLRSSAPVSAAKPATTGSRASRTRIGDELRDRRTPLLLGLAFAAVLAPQLVAALPTGLPRSTTSWYYWNLSQTTAASGALPDSVLEWGEARDFKGDYLPFTIHLAGAETLDQTGLATIETYRLLVLVAAALTLVAFARRWSLPGGVFLAGLFVSTNLWATKFGALRPESFALLLLIGSLWALDRAWTDSGSDRPAWVVLAGVLGGLVAASHIEVFVVGGAVGLALVVLQTGQSWRTRWVTAILSLAVAVLVAGGIFAATGSGIPGAGELGPQLAASGDPTWELYRSLIGGEVVSQPPPDDWTDERVLAATARYPWFQIDILDPARLAVLVGLLLVAMIAVVGTRAAHVPRRLLVFGAFVVVLLVVGSLVTFEAFPTYVPRRIGPRRFLPYQALGLSAILTAGALAGVEGLRAWRRHRRSAPDEATGGTATGSARRVAASVAGLACLVSSIGLLMAPGSFDRLLDPPNSPLSLTGRDAYLWISENAPTDARILVNGYTDGAVAALTGRAGILDGRAPYGEDPEWVAQASRDADLARRFFAAPTDAGLLALRADYVIVAPPGRLATAASYPVAPGALTQLAQLQPAATFADVTVYQVTETAR